MSIYSDVKMLIFSKNRALQLDLCLNSFYLQAEELPEINVIYKTDTKEHEISYKEILTKDHPEVKFIEETNFRGQVEGLLNKKYILFCVDDTIWCNPFSFDDVFSVMSDYTIGFSFRLGENTKYCYPLNMTQAPNAKIKYDNEILGYYWAHEMFDFGYPLELSSSLYNTGDILDTIKGRTFNSPNELEAKLDFYKKYHFINEKKYKPELLSYKKSVAFAAPMNRVQNIAIANRFSGNEKYDADYLLRIYLTGNRIDYRAFSGVVSNAAHMEVEYTYRMK
jgi:hypothetical protein